MRLQRCLVYSRIFPLFVSAISPAAEVIHWGSAVYKQHDVPPGNDFVAVTAHSNFGLALRSNGSLAAWGSIWTGVGYDPVTVPAGNDFAAISARGSQTTALKTDGALVEWYGNSHDSMTVLSYDGTLVAFSAGAGYTLGLVVPEPASLTLACAGALGGLLVVARGARSGACRADAARDEV